MRKELRFRGIVLSMLFTAGSFIYFVGCGVPNPGAASKAPPVIGGVASPEPSPVVCCPVPPI